MRLLSLIVLLIISDNVFPQNTFKNLTISEDSTYGFSVNNPLKMKKGDMVKSITYAETFLKNLITVDSQDLQYIGRASTHDPNYKKPFIQMNDRYSGTSVNGRGGMIDVYQFTSSVTKTNIVLYVDIYHKGELKIPLGLKLKETR